MTLVLNYLPRGGIHTVVTVNYPPDTGSGH